MACNTQLLYACFLTTAFSAGANFCNLTPKICTYNFCNFKFCDFTPWQSDFYSLDDMKNLNVNFQDTAFLWARNFIMFFFTEHDKPSLKNSVSRGLTCFLGLKANWTKNDLWFKLSLILITKLGSFVTNHDIKY